MSEVKGIPVVIGALVDASIGVVLRYEVIKKTALWCRVQILRSLLSQKKAALTRLVISCFQENYRRLFKSILDSFKIIIIIILIKRNQAVYFFEKGR